jgi:hypothetical protein
VTLLERGEVHLGIRHDIKVPIPPLGSHLLLPDEVLAAYRMLASSRRSSPTGTCGGVRL